MPSRFAVLPATRLGRRAVVRGRPTFVLHFTNAYGDGDEIVLDGFTRASPEPADDGSGQVAAGVPFLALDRIRPAAPLAIQPHDRCLHRRTVERQHLRVRNDQRVLRRQGLPLRLCGHRKPGWFLFDGLIRHDVVSGTEHRISFGDGVYGSETAMAPRVGSRGGDDGYLVTLTTD